MKKELSIHEAEDLGLCKRCVAYYPGEPMPPFSTHCHSTRIIGRLKGIIILCTRKEDL